MQDDRLALYVQAFFMSAYFVVSKYWYPCTPVYRLNGRTAFPDKCVEQRDRHGYFFIIMLHIYQDSNVAMLGCSGTSIHETDIRSFNSNALRVYNPTTGARHRKASATSEIRQKICRYFLDSFPDIRRIKIVDTGQLFSARVWFRSGRTFSEKAYSVSNLYGLLHERIDFILLQQ